MSTRSRATDCTFFLDSTPRAGQIAERFGFDTVHGHVFASLSRADHASGLLRPRALEDYLDDPFRDFADLYVTCQIRNDGTYAKMSYGWETGFHRYSSEYHPSDQNRLERAVRGLRRWNRAVERIRESIGSPRSFGQVVAYLGQGIGVSSLTVRSSSGSDSGFRIVDGRIADTVDREVERVLKQLRMQMYGNDEIPQGSEALVEV